MNKTIILLGLCAIIFTSSCTQHEEEHAEAIQYLVTSPLLKDTSIIKEYVCQIQSARHIELRNQERGYLQRIYVDEGQRVRKGQILFQIMPNLYNAEKQKAQAEANYTAIELKNTKGLADANIVSSTELALARAKMEKAKAEVNLANVHVQFTTIRAPFSGIINKLNMKLGSLVDEGELLTSLSDNSELWVYFNVPEAEYLDFKMSQNAGEKIPVNLRMANNKMFNQSGTVTAIEADFNNETGNIAFRATFLNPEGLLRNGETGNIQRIAPLTAAIIIPQKATYEVLDNKYVFIVDKNNVVHSKKITVLADMEDIYVVSGLKTTDKILLEGLRKVRDKDKIEYKYQKPETVLGHLKNFSE